MSLERYEHLLDDAREAAMPDEPETVRCAACGAVVNKDAADRRFLTPEDAAEDNSVYVCQDCSAGLDELNALIARSDGGRA
jgi:DNA-directed RNA polymerase subunit RPC12/RpoP